MRRPPPLIQAPLYPATAGTILLSLIATVAWWARVDVSLLLADAHLAHGQLWRMFTSTLLHRDPIHLCFNVFWLWTFGTLIEQHLGVARTFALFGFLAAGSSAAEFAMLDGGVGLSGVMFGLFGLLWTLGRPGERFDERFGGVIDSKTTKLFVGWFCFCAVMTLIGVLPVANLSHAAGAVLGGAVAYAMTSRQSVRWKRWSGPGIAMLVLLLAATFARPQVNISSRRGQQEAYLGFQALTADRDREAERWMIDATTMNPKVARWWFNLAVARDRLLRHSDAFDAYSRACVLDPGNKQYREARDTLQTYLAGCVVTISE